MSFDLSPIYQHFPELTEEQRTQFETFATGIAEWNEKINLISRTDIENLPIKHILHSLAIAKTMPFVDGTHVLDVGTGGGLPGIPLAILFPNCRFHMVDAIGKKIMVVNDLIEQIGLKNATAAHERADKVKNQYDFIVARAVTQLPKFMNWIRNKIKRSSNNALANGVLYLKGGDLSEEFYSVKEKNEITTYALEDYFDYPEFELKFVIHVPVKRKAAPVPTPVSKELDEEEDEDLDAWGNPKRKNKR